MVINLHNAHSNIKRGNRIYQAADHGLEQTVVEWEVLSNPNNELVFSATDGQIAFVFEKRDINSQTFFTTRQEAEDFINDDLA